MEGQSPVVPAPRIKESVSRLKENIERTIRGKPKVVDRILYCLLASGHVLIEDLPGLGKTTLAYCLARSTDCEFSRIQFTSDMLPSDIIGVSIYDERTKEFVFKAGPIFANVVLADEINRTTPKTQSSLLEVMDRARVSVDGQTHAVGQPFMVIATQNPVDYEGTFPLPDSQMDRFLMRISVGYPEHEDEVEILRSGELRYDELAANAVVSKEEIIEMQQHARAVYVEQSILEYIVQLVQATRTESEFRSGVSPRGAIALRMAAQACALAHGRAFVVPEDVETLIMPVLAHRITLRRQLSDPVEGRRMVETCLKAIVEKIPLPV